MGVRRGRLETGLEAIKLGLYDAYRRGQTPDDGSLLGAHPSVPPGHIRATQRVQYAARRWISRNQPAAAAVTGGGPVTDNHSRLMFNPSHPGPGSKGGVMLAAYCWADARR
ncbi:hypothetical protein [Streptomyces sp. NPDC002851]